MQEFFRGRKRKIGVVMLMMACVLISGWLRSPFLQRPVSLIKSSLLSPTAAGRASSMNDFRPWRRKIGVVALLLSCVFAAGWVRSLSRIDMLFVADNAISISGNGNIVLTRSVRIREHLRGGIVIEGTFTSLSCGQQLWRFSSLDSGSTKLVEYDRRMVPYWSIVVPLTAISVGLLLSKPQVVKVR